MPYQYRCTKQLSNGKQCFRRVSFKKKLEDYARPKHCPACGAVITYRDNYKRKENRQKLCLCDGAHYPHRKGSLVWCVHHPTGPTDEDYRDLYGLGPD